MDLIDIRPVLPISLEVVKKGEGLVESHWWVGMSSDTIDWRSHLYRDKPDAPMWRGSSKSFSSWKDRSVVLDDVMDLADYFGVPRDVMRQLFCTEIFHVLPPRFFALWRRHIEATESLPRREFEMNRRMADWIDPEYVI